METPLGHGSGGPNDLGDSVKMSGCKVTLVNLHVPPEQPTLGRKGIRLTFLIRLWKLTASAVKRGNTSYLGDANGGSGKRSLFFVKKHPPWKGFVPRKGPSFCKAPPTRWCPECSCWPLKIQVWQ